MELEISGVVALLLAAILLVTSLLRNREKTKPPQPPSWPIIGHLRLLNKKQPLHRILFSLSQRHGHMMLLHLGRRPVLVISSSELAKECLTTNDRTFASRPRVAAGKHLGYDYHLLLWAPYGPVWRDLRKLCTLHLFSAHRIDSFKHTRLAEVSSAIHSLFIASPGGKVNMKSILQDLTFNIILQTVASKRMSSSHEIPRFREMLEEALPLAGTFNVVDYMPFLGWIHLDRHLKAAMIKLQIKRDAFMQMLVDEHREKRRTHPEQDDDFIDVLLSATDDDTLVKATALSMIAGGKDTSAVTLEWALAALMQHPHILTRAQQEVDALVGRDRIVEESDLPKLKYLEAIVKETLRLYPAGGPVLIPHESTEACRVGGFEVPAGTRLLVNVWVIQRDPKVWERPTEFDPQRFLEEAREIDVRGQHFELIPFGAGRRMCPGMSLALRGVSYILARLLQSFEWNVAEGTTVEMEEGFGLTMAKAVPLEAIIKPRLPPHLY